MQRDLYLQVLTISRFCTDPRLSAHSVIATSAKSHSPEDIRQSHNPAQPPLDTLTLTHLLVANHASRSLKQTRDSLERCWQPSSERSSCALPGLAPRDDEIFRHLKGRLHWLRAEDSSAQLHPSPHLLKHSLRPTERSLFASAAAFGVRVSASAALSARLPDCSRFAQHKRSERIKSHQEAL